MVNKLERIRSLLIIGLDIASLASSAKDAGYTVYGIDYFGDSNLSNSCALSFSITNQREGVSCGKVDLNFNPQDLLILARKLVKTCNVDGILLSSGLEDYPQIISDLNELSPIIGNNASKISRVRDRERFFTELKRIGVKHPKTKLVRDFQEAKSAAGDIGYPVIVKPVKGFGGSGIRKILNSKKLEAILASSFPRESVLIQEYIEGKAASASVISTTGQVQTLTINEQLLGKRSLGENEPFGYCGNIVPLNETRSVIKLCENVSEKVVRHFDLLGSNGVDFIITKEGQPQVIEINPRFQGTLECVERVLDINLTKAHIEGCTSGVLPKIGKANCFCIRLILFALKRSKIPDLSRFEGARDIPFQGVIIEKGEPLCSVVAFSSRRMLALKKARKLAENIYKTIP